MSPLAALLPERTSPELLYLETKFASLVSYGLTTRLLGELLPVERPIGAERVRRHLFRVARSHEAALDTTPTHLLVDAATEADDATPPDGPLFVGLVCNDNFDVLLTPITVSGRRVGSVVS